MSICLLQVREIVEDLIAQKKKTRELTKVLFGQIVVFVLMCAIIFAVVVCGMKFTQATWVKDRILLDVQTQKPVRAANVENTESLMYVTTLPTEAFSHLKTVTVVFDMAGALTRLCCVLSETTANLQSPSHLP